MSQATARIGFRADIPLSTVSFYVNEAYQEVAQAAHHGLLEGTAWFSVNSGTSILSLPNDFLEMINLSSHSTTGSNFTLKQTSPELADAAGYYPLGQPQEYFVFGSGIQLRPSANSSAATNAATSGRSFLLRYYQRPSDMTALTAVPSIDTEWRRAVLYRAEGLLHEYVGNEEEGAVALARFNSYVASLKDAQAKRQASKSRQAVSLPLRRRRTSG
jgi:hypothetical protein